MNYFNHPNNKNIIMKLDQYNENNVFFCDPIKNNIMTEGNYIRILYSSDICTLNGISLLFTIHNIVIEKYYNKFKYVFDVNTHEKLIKDIQQLEFNILQKIHTNKTPQYKIYNQLKHGHIKIFMDTQNIINTPIILKISGIWETDTEYGITYKFINA